MATKVYIVYYSMYGHVEKLAEGIRKGAASVEGVEAKLWQVPETLPEEALLKMSAPPKSGSPIITPNDLTEADGFVLGFPTRFGMMAAQFKAFLDATGGLWRTQALAGKPAGIFYSTGSQGGGQETTALTAITQLVHHGMIFVPIGYTFGAGMFEMEKVKAGARASVSPRQVHCNHHQEAQSIYCLMLSNGFGINKNKKHCMFCSALLIYIYKSIVYILSL
ncbi:hypothetical protein F2Q70_00004958 [Brassica cretica]|uniref:NAD(P)H dehydrogenase (quinone) n=1 Tax=Brassica cretica TaxID=69181 RepID=A0A8S9J0F5_BRACR|nr:hypothetical protein F2Q70_00004958 [Brassica cretica]